jgi:signal transduction histidine kinase/CheY-like chemotaxis protein
MQQRSVATSYLFFALLAAATLTVVALGVIVAQDLRRSAEAANQLYDRFGEGLDLIDEMLFETEEVRRVLLYALHTSDANRQLEYVDQSRAAEGRVARLLETRSAILSRPGTSAARETVEAAWASYLETRDEVVGLILEGSLREGVELDEAVGAARFTRVRDAIAGLKTSFKGDAARQVDVERTRATRDITLLAAIGVSTLLLVAIGVYLVNRRASLESILRVKTDFLTTMSHELRTPLTGVIGITDLLQTAGVAAAQRELVRMLRTNATTLLALVDNVLDYSRIEAGQTVLTPRRFSVQGVVEDALDSVTELAVRKGLALGCVIAPGTPDVVADEDRVRQVLLNLLSNAVKYTTSGEIGVYVDATMEAPGVIAVAIRVRDTGIGIPGELQGRLFQWFSQIDSPGHQRVHSTGLGLAISARLSRLLGGSVTVKSRHGEGSTFTFVFRGTAAECPHAPDEDALRGTRMLAVLKNGIVREQVESLLQRWGVERVAAPAEDVRGSVQAIIVDADACDRASFDTAFPLREASRDTVAFVAIGRLGARDGGDAGISELCVPLPIRTRPFYEALCMATRRAVIASPVVQRTHATAISPHTSVLVVEDNEPNRRVVLLMLAELGLEADEAAGGFEAVERAAGRRYDIILMDVQMPDLDGLETTRRIRAQERDHRATIVALTANVFESDEARCRDAGMDGYLQKPMRLDALSDALHAVAGPVV